MANRNFIATRESLAHRGDSIRMLSDRRLRGHESFQRGDQAPTRKRQFPRANTFDSDNVCRAVLTQAVVQDVLWITKVAAGIFSTKFQTYFAPHGVVKTGIGCHGRSTMLGWTVSSKEGKQSQTWRKGVNLGLGLDSAGEIRLERVQVLPHSFPGSSLRWPLYTRGPQAPSFMTTRILMLPDMHPPRDQPDQGNPLSAPVYAWRGLSWRGAEACRFGPCPAA